MTLPLNFLLSYQHIFTYLMIFYVYNSVLCYNFMGWYSCHHNGNLEDFHHPQKDPQAHLQSVPWSMPNSSLSQPRMHIVPADLPFLVISCEIIKYIVFCFRLLLLVFGAHLCCSRSYQFVPFYFSVVFCCMAIPHLLMLSPVGIWIVSTLGI